MQSFIISDPDILNGKPRVAGARLSLEFILELLASVATREEILTAHPQLTAEGLSAVLEYAARSMRSEVMWERKVSA